MSDDAYERRLTVLTIVAFSLIVGLIAADLLTDWDEGADPVHLGLELLVLLIAFAGAAVLWRRLQRARLSLQQLQDDLARARAQAGQWQQDNEHLVRGLGAAIKAQFVRWQLSEAEAEVALLLLKGLSLREVAAVRATSERTAREQARAVYRKAGLSGRPALSAFFLEDLLAPDSDAR